MSKATQVSAPVSKETKDALERYSKATGIKKGHLIEDALRYHLRAVHELPADVLVPPRLVLTKRSFQALVDKLASPGVPTAALRELMRGDRD